MNDYLVRVIAKEAGVRGLACLCTGVVQEAARRHGTTPLCTAALGYGVTGAALLGALLKVQQRVGLRVIGDGRISKLVAESDSYGHLRAYIWPPDVWSPLPIGTEEVQAAIGDQGFLSVVKDLGLKDLAEGVVPLQSGLLDVDLTYYLMMSEQAPSLVEIGVKLNQQGVLQVAGGVLLQTLPDHAANILSDFADRLDDLPPLGEVLGDGQRPEDILATLFAGRAYETLETRALDFRCNCSRERSKMALRLINSEDLEVLRTEGEAVVDCHFCHERYVFSLEELTMIQGEAARDE